MTTHDEPKSYDVRTLERKLRQGGVSRKEYEKYLKALPDRADNILPAGATLPDDDADDDEG